MPGWGPTVQHVRECDTNAVRLLLPYGCCMDGL